MNCSQALLLVRARVEKSWTTLSTAVDSHGYHVYYLSPKAVAWSFRGACMAEFHSNTSLIETCNHYMNLAISRKEDMRRYFDDWESMKDRTKEDVLKTIDLSIELAKIFEP